MLYYLLNCHHYIIINIAGKDTIPVFCHEIHQVLLLGHSICCNSVTITSQLAANKMVI